jgi:hypothetical protein
MKRSRSYTIAISLLIVVLIATACVIPKTAPDSTTAIPVTPTTISRPPLSADEVKTIGAEFEKIASADTEAWDKGDLELMRPYYASDIIIYDAYPDEHFVQGADDLISLMMDYPIKNHPNLEVQLADTFIARGIGLEALDMWGFIDIPSTLYYLYTLRDGKIAEWWTYMGSVNAAADGTPIPEKLLLDYATAWSSGDPETVASLYNPNIVRQDTLLRENQQGSTAMKEFATKYFAWYPGVRLELKDSLQWSAKDLGGVYAIHGSDETGKPCDVRAIILLEVSQDKIVKERLLYNAGTLIACGWAK